ncbi:thymidine kinase [Vairimorpha necatrix]|uniref:thymidine kinase n=1 Tax=Vairimorpha necatrix TaxID=6039 RepID=A0AAX4JBR3_9MICR
MVDFYTGSVLSGKSKLLSDFLNILNEKQFWLLQRDIPNHKGEFKIHSRVPGTQEFTPNLIVTKNTNLFEKFEELENKSEIKLVCCDEIQFFTENHVDQLIEIQEKYGVVVKCFGISETHDNKTWDTIKYLKTKVNYTCRIQSGCHYCDKPAVTNIRADLNSETQLIDSINDGESEKYYGCCLECHNKKYKNI